MQFSGGFYVVTKFILQSLHIFIVLHRLSICHSHFEVFYKQEKQEIPQELDKAQLSKNKAICAIFSGHFGNIQS